MCSGERSNSANGAIPARAAGASGCAISSSSVLSDWTIRGPSVTRGPFADPPSRTDGRGENATGPVPIVQPRTDTRDSTAADGGEGHLRRRSGLSSRVDVHCRHGHPRGGTTMTTQPPGPQDPSAPQPYPGNWGAPPPQDPG